MPETTPETIWRSVYDPDILFPEATLCIRKPHCVSGSHIVCLEDRVRAADRKDVRWTMKNFPQVEQHLLEMEQAHESWAGSVLAHTPPIQPSAQPTETKLPVTPLLQKEVSGEPAKSVGNNPSPDFDSSNGGVDKDVAGRGNDVLTVPRTGRTSFPLPPLHGTSLHGGTAGADTQVPWASLAERP